MDKREAVEFLHKSKGYSRRMSAKLVDLAFLEKSNSVFALAMNQALEKARLQGAKDKQPRKKKGKSYPPGKTEAEKKSWENYYKQAGHLS